MMLFIVCSPCRSSDTQRRLASSLVGISQDNSETQAGCKSKRRSSGQDPAHEEMWKPRLRAGDEHVQPSPGVKLHLLLWAVSLCSLAITCAQIATTGNMQWFICPCNYCNCDHSCGNGTGKQSITHPDWEVALPPRSSNSISSYTLLAEQPQQDVLSQCSPVQCHSVLLWQGNKLLSLIRHFPSVPQHGAFWRQQHR